jgi:general secretion pathway protein K
LKTKPNPKPRRHGIALMMVMVVIFALTVIIAAFAYSMTVEMRLAQITDYDVELQWMGRSGVELARYALAVKCPGYEGIDALNQFWAGGTAPCSNDLPPITLKDFPLGAGKITVTITDMERKFDLNLVAKAPPQMDLLQKAMMEAGVTDPAQSSTIIESIVDWISPTLDPHASGAKDEYYTHLPVPYHCKSGNIDDITELLLIKGITPDIYWGSNSTDHPGGAYQVSGKARFAKAAADTKRRFNNEADQATVPVALTELFSAMGGKLNINTASAKTLQLLPGIDASTAERIIQQRAGPDGIDGTDDDAPFHSIGEMAGIMPPGSAGMPPPGAPPQVPPGFGAAPGTPPGTPPGAPPGVPPQTGLAAFCDVRSYVFEVKVEAEINNYKRSFTGIVSRAGADPSQITCVRFHWN